jgi:predicted HicB family RNase H-like nuclease
MMKYKGYTGRITSVDERLGLLHGEVVGLTDVVTFEGKSAEELVQAFHDSVDDYLEFCAERAEEPEKPCSGKFLVRITPGMHRKAVLAARKAKESLNAWVGSAIKAHLEHSRQRSKRGTPGTTRPAS